MHVVAWLPTWLIAVVMAAFARQRGRSGTGLMLAATIVLLPDVARYSGLGMADGAMAAAILLAAIGLAFRHQRRDGLALAMLAAVGACALKED